MHIVIDIPEHIFESAKAMQVICGGRRSSGKTFLSIFVNSLQNGTPLPKVHGDLIDKNVIIKRYERDCGKRIYVDNFIHDIELNIPTIIEADKESEEEDG